MYLTISLYMQSLLLIMKVGRRCRIEEWRCALIEAFTNICDVCEDTNSFRIRFISSLDIIMMLL